MKLTNENLANFMIDNEIDLYDVVDVVIENNGIIGVGLITFGDAMKDYVTGKILENRGDMT